MDANKPAIFSKSTLGNIFGNSLEWYDFVLYGSLATVISHHFFPAKNALVSLMLTFVVFAVGFLARPVGGLIFGHFGDTKGRRKPLLWSITLMVIPTILIGLLPGYQTLGLLSPILVALIRIFQGLAVGGEFAGSMVYLSEISDSANRGFFASFASFGIFTGLLLGPIVILITNLFMNHQTFFAWGWRIPFLFSIVLGCVVYYWRRSMQETTAFVKETEKKSVSKSPVRLCFSSYKKNMLLCACLSAQVGIPFWLIMVYSITYFTKILHAPFGTVETQNMYAIILVIITTPFFGWLTKKISAWHILLATSVAYIILSYVLNLMLINNVMDYRFYLAHFIATLMVSAYLAAFIGFIASLFPTEVRYTGIAISYNVALAVFGGTAPLLVTAMIKSGLLAAPGIALTIGGVIAFVALLFAKRWAKY